MSGNVAASAAGLLSGQALADYSAAFPGAGRPTIDPTRRVVLKVDGAELDTWTSVRIVRGLHEICGSFELEYWDTGRAAQTLTDLVDAAQFAPVRAGQKCQVFLDGELVLSGWIDRLHLHQTAAELRAGISGRDICGDLVDSAAAPRGPAEFMNVTLAQFARQLCQPFGIGVLVQTDIGAPFPKLSITPHEKVLSGIDKAARQRAVLTVSDGVGNLVLTTAGSARAPAGLTFGDNVVVLEYEEDQSKRFSDIFVKGQTARARGNHAIPAHMTPASAPGGAAPAAATTQAEAAGILMTGHAQDPEITRWRPDVRMVATQSGSSTVQEQAEWHVRVDRGQAIKTSYTVLDWRAGPDLQLWRPNTLVAVYDPYAGIDDDMLIAGITYTYSEAGERTELSVVGKTAYDRINEPARKMSRHGLRSK